eukprot:gene21361-28299_t
MVPPELWDLWCVGLIGCLRSCGTRGGVDLWCLRELWGHVGGVGSDGASGAVGPVGGVGSDGASGAMGFLWLGDMMVLLRS